MATPATFPLVIGIERLQRSAWVVVVPEDVVTGRPAQVALRVRIEDVEAEPIVGRSGVYAFTDLALEAGAYTVLVEPIGRDRERYFDAAVPFALVPVPVPGQPLNRNRVPVPLRPRASYPFPDQTTLARGQLVKGSDGTPLARAGVVLILDGADLGVLGETDERGAFVVAFPPSAPEDTADAGLKTLPFDLRFEVDNESPLTDGPHAVVEGQAIWLGEVTFPGV